MAARGPRGRLDPTRPGKSKPLPSRVSWTTWEAIQIAAARERRPVADWIRVTLEIELERLGLLTPPSEIATH